MMISQRYKFRVPQMRTQSEVSSTAFGDTSSIHSEIEEALFAINPYEQNCIKKFLAENDLKNQQLRKQYEHVERILQGYANPVRDSTGTGFSQGHEKIMGNGNKANEIVTQKIIP